MKRIVIDARESGTSTGRYLDKLVEYLHPLHPKYDIVLLAKTHRIDYLRGIAPTFTVIETPFKEFTFGEQLGFRTQIEGLHPDLVHFPMVHQPILHRGKVVTTMQDLTTIRFRNPIKNPVIFWVKLQVYKWVNRIAAHKSVAIITPTAFVKQDVADYTHVDPSKITVTLESADQIPDRPASVPAVQGKQYIMYTGRPTPHKNLARLIDAFKLLQAERPSLYLVLVGKQDGNYQLHANRVAAEGIPNVIFTGFVSDAQLRWLLEHCAVYAMPSLSEGFSLTGLEAMIHGAPVASSNATCLPEVYGDAAHYFNPLDAEDVAARISDILDDPKLRAELIAKGKKQAAKYSWKRMAEQTLAVYEKALRA